MGITTFDNIDIRDDLQGEIENIRVGYDGTVYPTAGDAVRTVGIRHQVVQDTMADFLSEYIDEKFVNVLDIVNVYYDRRFDNNGNVVIDNNVTTFVFRVTPESTLHVHIDYPVTNLRGLIGPVSSNIIDENTHTTLIHSNAGYDFTIEVPVDCHYLAWYISSVATDIYKLFNEKIKITASNPSTDKISKEKLDIDHLAPKFDIFTVSSEFTQGGYYRLTSSNGVELVNTDSAAHTEIIQIPYGYKYLHVYAVISSVAPAFVLLDANRYEIYSVMGEGSSSPINQTVDLENYPDAVYACASYYDATHQFANADFTFYNEGNITDQIKNLDNRVSDLETGMSNDAVSIMVYGDSITDTVDTLTVDNNLRTSQYVWNEPDNSYIDENNNRIYYLMWPSLIKRYLNTSEVRNYARAGASWKDQERTEGNERQNVSYQIRLSLNDLDNPNNVFPTDDFNPDIVIFALGVNDGDLSSTDTYESAMAKTVTVNSKVDVEATLNNLDMSKTIEAMRWSLLKARQAFPQALFVFVSQLQKATDPDNRISTRDNMVRMAKRYGCVIVDGYAESGIIYDLETPNGLGVNLKDGLHPNEKGQNMLARAIITTIKSHYVSFDRMNQ